MRKMMAASAIAASGVGFPAAAAPHAMAMGGQDGTRTVSGNGSKSVYGNSRTHGKRSTQLGLLQGSLNEFRVGLPAKGDVGSLFGGVPVTVEDINVMSSPQNQQCTRNSTQAKGDEVLSHVIDDIPIHSGNGRRHR
ncbi:rodlin [Streptomyces sp. CT34]|uniref:rodlin n=1 Tax=Streptomyces sp. CT34 TaxID=1553907 RepID=UPI0005BC6514|nr:rodlin [Streptomyces sp. CT34]